VEVSSHEYARAVRDEVFGRRVFVRGAVEVSSHCRENCHYCGMRRDNQALKRYRLAADELAELIIHRRPAAITDIDIHAGEDALTVSQVVLPLVRELRRRTTLGITLCLGTLSPRDYDGLREAGSDCYLMKIETGNSEHYDFIGAPGTLAERSAAICYLASKGWKVFSGLISGLPAQTEAQLEQTLNLLTLLPLDGCSVSPFVAGDQTTFGSHPNGDLEEALNHLAWMRLRSPRWLIAASSALQLLSENGYVRAFNAGANLAAINLTPPSARADYPIYKRDRVIMEEDRVLSAIQAAGCDPSPVSIADHLRDATGRKPGPTRAAASAKENSATELMSSPTTAPLSHARSSTRRNDPAAEPHSTAGSIRPDSMGTMPPG